MPEREKVVAVVREWVAKAENDLKNATHSLKLGEDCPTDTVCFHAQQCVEKYLKAMLVLRRLSGETANTAPVMTLITQFSGGTLTALYHLVTTGAKARTYRIVGQVTPEVVIE